MCGRYVLTQKIEVLEKRFNIQAPVGFEWEANYNITPGTYVPVITDNAPQIVQLFRFGLMPAWAKKKMLLINARAEGDRNLDNDPLYKGSRDIINKPAFRKPIRSQRCLVPADCFIEGTTQNKLDEPYVVYLRNKVRPFAFAGIWDCWKDPETGEEIYSFAIITTVANAVLQALPHHRSPVILQRGDEKKWLNPHTPLGSITSLLFPYSADLMNAYRINAAIKNPKANGKEGITPISDPLFSENNVIVTDVIRKNGFGRNR